MNNVFYFAYGSNLDPERIKDRLKGDRDALIACLERYRLAFNKKAKKGGVYANIVASPENCVWGVAYHCNKEDLDILDSCEGVSTHYQHLNIQVKLLDGTYLNAQTYIANPDQIVKESVPDSRYLEHILKGLHHHKLPQEYIQFVQSLCGASD